MGPNLVKASSSRTSTISLEHVNSRSPPGSKLLTNQRLVSLSSEDIRRLNNTSEWSMIKQNDAALFTHTIRLLTWNQTWRWQCLPAVNHRLQPHLRLFLKHFCCFFKSLRLNKPDTASNGKMCCLKTVISANMDLSYQLSVHLPSPNEHSVRSPAARSKCKNWYLGLFDSVMHFVLFAATLSCQRLKRVLLGFSNTYTLSMIAVH